MTCEFCNFDFRFPRDSINGTSWSPSMKFRILLPLAPLVALAGCGSSPPPPQTFPPLDYSYLPPIVLKVSHAERRQ